MVLLLVVLRENKRAGGKEIEEVVSRVDEKVDETVSILAD